MVEPLPYHRDDDGTLTLRKDAPALARAITIASGLGTTSAYTWLKMPSCDDSETVFGATTLPCVVLGGVPSPDPAADLESWGATLVPARPSADSSSAGRCSTRPDGDVRVGGARRGRRCSTTAKQAGLT